jgi:putative ABC transport system permease protein
MRAALRQFRRAPGRIIASVFALSLAIGAVGVMAIPAVARQPLRDVATRDGLADMVVSTTALDDEQIAQLAEIPGVERIEASTSAVVDSGSGDIAVVGMQLTDQRIDRLHVVDGRLPAGNSEALASPGFHSLGDVVTIGATQLRVVGHGDTLWFSGSDTLYTTVASALAVNGSAGPDRIAIQSKVDTSAALRRIAADAREVISAKGDSFTSFPFYLPGERTPIEADIEQISTLIGLLGVVAGLVALVLLASTTNTLITERSRESAVMRGDHRCCAGHRIAARGADREPHRSPRARRVRRHHPAIRIQSGRARGQRRRSVARRPPRVGSRRPQGYQAALGRSAA